MEQENGTLGGPPWRKSTYSGYNGNCAEVIVTADAVFLRDSKDPSGPVLQFTPGDWTAFTAAVKAGDHDAQPAVPDELLPPELQAHPRRGRRHRTSP